MIDIRAGSMGPKVTAAADFVTRSKSPDAWAIIGDLRDAATLMSGEKGTKITKDVPSEEGVVWREGAPVEEAPE